MTGASDKTGAAGSSPACSMHEADDAYMGYADTAELVAILNELLEAERAGTRVALETARGTSDAPLAALMRAIEFDEARWCAMLAGHVKALGAVPSRAVGGFHGKAMAIAEWRDRLLFLNRGQGWVVRKLRELLPRVRSDALHADLTAMLEAHEANIARAAEFVANAP